MASIDISVKDANQVKTFIELVASYASELPEGLIKSLHDISDCKAFEVDRDSLNLMGINPCDVVIKSNGIELDRVVSFNPILKRVTHHWVSDGDIHVINNEILDIYTWHVSLDVFVGGNKLNSLGW
ncbi:hypothetical protein NVP1135O_23 [Vibrio phage 1.135.O._10N.222.54.B6]|nr:hypothetical protein NVP1135O_23 [Vibrio phage 1.135.O._10N.222.54.B6]